MMHKLHVVFFFSLALLACSQQFDPERITNDTIEISVPDTSVDTEESIDEELIEMFQPTDSVFYGTQIFIPVWPSNRYLDSIQKISPEDEWNEVVSDNEYYRDLTEKYLLKNQYKITRRPDRRFWYFKLLNGNVQVIDTLDLDSSWGNLIFNGKDSAFIFDSCIPEEELKGKI